MNTKQMLNLLLDNNITVNISKISYYLHYEFSIGETNCWFFSFDEDSPVDTRIQGNATSIIEQFLGK